ncbi:MAG: large subunit ribosomal protein L24 [Glaciecola sp.]|jgi:large subunit ribosomal protein L24
MANKLKIKKGDTVKVITGNDKGTSGVVLKVLADDRKLIVEGVKMVKKHTKPSATNPQGGIVELEAAIDISNVMLLDGDVASRVGRKVVEGKVQRFVKKTDKILG